MRALLYVTVSACIRRDARIGTHAARDDSFFVSIRLRRVHLGVYM